MCGYCYAEKDKAVSGGKESKCYLLHGWHGQRRHTGKYAGPRLALFQPTAVLSVIFDQSNSEHYN